MTPLDVQVLHDAWGALIEERYTLEGIMAPFRARYGAFGTFEHERKKLLAACAAEARLGAREKISEAAIEQAARQHPDYDAFIERAYAERTQLALYDADETRLSALIELRKNQAIAATRLAGVV